MKVSKLAAKYKSFLVCLVMLLQSSNAVAEEGSGITQDDLMEFLTDDVDDVIIKCYVCPNSSAQSCEMESLRQNPDDYLSQCSGHCMNISTENNTVFACTEDVPVKNSRCFTNGGIAICTCPFDLCNGPALPVNRQLTSVSTQRTIDSVSISLPTPAKDVYDRSVKDHSPHLVVDFQIILLLIWLSSVFQIIIT